MIKRITSLLLALLLSFALVTAAFAADAPDAAEPVPTKIYFDTTDTGWKEIGYIGFHIWGVDGEAFYDWGAKGQRGTDEGDGVWSYDPSAKGINLDPEKQYAVIFYSDKGAQTYNLLFDTTCLGDIAYPDPSQITENPEDSNKTAMPAYWQNQDPAVNGPELKISSIGNVIGSCIPRSTTREEMLTDYLQNTFENACLYSGLSAQQILDNIGEGLGFTADEMETIIAESGVSVDWDKKLSDLPRLYPVLPGEASQVPYTVDVAEGEGTASGDKEILTINYTVAPDYQYDTVTLTATPETGWYFAGWRIEGSYAIEGDGKLTDAVLTIRAHDGIAAHAVFYGEDWDGTPSWVPYTVEVAEGEGTAKGDKDILIINYTVAPDYQYDTLTLTATPTGDSHFCCWTIEGDYVLEEGCKITDAVITLRAHDGIAARAWFTENVPGSSDYVPYTVDVAQGEGTATGDKEILTINYTVAPDYQYDTLTLTATPTGDSHFCCWTIEGDYVLEDGFKLTDAVITLRAHDGIAARAWFTENVPGRSDYVPYTVDVSVGEGTATGDKEILTINYSVAPDYQYDTLTLTATPAEGYSFYSWDIVGDYTLEEGCKLTDAVITLRAHDSIAAHAQFTIDLPVEPAPTGIRGDADRDGKITILDATRIQRILVNLEKEWSDMTDADADRDGKITILDATRIQRVLAKLCEMDDGDDPKLKPDEYELPLIKG